MQVSVEEMKEYLLIDGNHQDSVIKDLIEASEAELHGSGVRDMVEGDKLHPLYKLAVKILVSRYFEDRGLAEADNIRLDYMISKLAMDRGNSDETVQ